MASGISINLSLAQIALFFTITAIGVITVSAIFLEAWVNGEGNSTNDAMIGCSSTVLICGSIQLISGLLLYFKHELKSKWVSVQVFLLIIYLVCFSIPLAEGARGTSVSDAFFAVVLVNWILLFLAIGFFSDNSSLLGIFYSMLGVAVVVSSSLVLKAHAEIGESEVIGFVSAAIALVCGIIQTGLSILLFFTENVTRAWTYVCGVICAILVICFAVTLGAAGIQGSQIEYFYAVLAIDFVALFIVVFMFMKAMHFLK